MERQRHAMRADRTEQFGKRRQSVSAAPGVALMRTARPATAGLPPSHELVAGERAAAEAKSQGPPRQLGSRLNATKYIRLASRRQPCWILRSTPQARSRCNYLSARSPAGDLNFARKQARTSEGGAGAQS